MLQTGRASCIQIQTNSPATLEACIHCSKCAVKRVKMLALRIPTQQEAVTLAKSLAKITQISHFVSLSELILASARQLDDA